MRLKHLIPVLCDDVRARAACAEFGEIEVTAIVNDSRAAGPGAMFVALKGEKTDGHKFIGNAIAAGAAVVVSERPVALPRAAVHFVVPDARRRMSALGAVFHGDPTARLVVTGITGTNGKTTTCFRARSMLESAGLRTGLVGTIWYEVAGRRIPAPNTTPESLPLQALFAEMVEAGLTHAVMEVSSHALALHRVADVRFRVGVFTNLSNREHLDYHGTLEEYRSAKARLFEMLPSDGFAVLNADDPAGKFIAERTPARVVWFGMETRADVTAEVRSIGMKGTVYRLATPAGSAEVCSPLVGRFNVMNDLAATGAALSAGVGLDAVVRALETDAAVPGRLEKVSGGDIFAVVDYAHNEGALESVLATVRPLATKRLIVVFGCGGDRDRTKRPAMGAVSERYADVIFLTTDNARSEEPERILAEIEAGMTGSRPRFVIPDREMAIRAAAAAAEPGDVVLVAGKGHETYQIIGSETHPFDDRDVLRRAVSERAAARAAAQPALAEV